MKILICVASRHHATKDIGARLAERLKTSWTKDDHGVEVDVREAHEHIDVEGYDAAIVGSALYMGKWLPAARDFVTANAAHLATIPLWLFSSGPLGNPPVPAGDPPAVAEMARLVSAREHRVFAGRLEKEELTFGERSIARAVRAPYGDFRDFNAVFEWADTIAHALVAEHAH